MIREAGEESREGTPVPRQGCQKTIYVRGRTGVRRPLRPRQLYTAAAAAAAAGGAATTAAAP